MKDNEKIKSYATAIFQNAMVGVQSIRDIEPKITDPGLKREVLFEADSFNKLAEELKAFAQKNGIEVKENNFFEKSRLWASINMGTMFDTTPRHIAEMLLLGTVMGLTTCYKDRYDHKNIDKTLDSILDKLEKIEEDNYSRLKTFLKEM